MDLFRKLFGIHSDEDLSNRYPQFDRNEPDDPFTRRGFDIFSNPLEMHQYFEHQMNEILKRFGFQEFDHFSFNIPNNPSLEYPTDNNNNTDLRDQFLKPGYEKPKTNPAEMLDKDLDDKVKSGEFGSFLNETPTKKSRNYYNEFSHGTQQSIKYISKPDGSIETHSSVKDSFGNEETSVCHKLGDKEYCIIKKKDKNGQEETTEKLVNMTEDEKNIFLKIK